MTIKIITFNSDPTTTATTEQQTITNATTEQQTITNETTTMGTNDGSKDNVIQMIIGAVSGTFGLIIIITIIVYVMRRKTNDGNATNKIEITRQCTIKKINTS